MGQERQCRWRLEEKLEMARLSLEPGQSVSVVAINANQLFPWRSSIMSVLSARGACASELSDALKQICDLQPMRGKEGSRNPSKNP